MPSLSRDAPRFPRSVGELGPRFAWPSERRMIRFTRWRSTNLRTSAAPLLTPANSAVFPPADSRSIDCSQCSPVGDLGCRYQYFDGVVIGNDRNDVIRAETIDGCECRVLCLPQLVPLHGTGLVEDDRQIDGGSSRRIDWKTGQSNPQKTRLFLTGH